LSLAIGKEGQNARLAAKLTGFKIDIKSESQAKEEGIQYVFNEEDYAEDYYDDEYYDDEYYDDEYYDDEYYDGEYDAEAEEEVTETAEASDEE
jgi:N utilization substance protein A